MNSFETEAIKELKAYNTLHQSAKCIRERIEMLEASAEGIRSPYSGEPTGTAAGRDSIYADNIDKRNELAHRLDVINRRIRIIDSGLEALSERERTVITSMYIERRSSSAVTELCEKLHLEKTAVYGIRKTALAKFTAVEFGNVEK